MTILYAALIAALIAAAAGTVLLKRAGEREWRKHQAARALDERMARIRGAFVQVRIVMHDDFTPAMARSAASLRQLERAFEGGAR